MQNSLRMACSLFFLSHSERDSDASSTAARSSRTWSGASPAASLYHVRAGLSLPVGRIVFLIASRTVRIRPKFPAPKIEFRQSPQADLGRPVLARKITALHSFDSAAFLVVSRARKRGASRSSRTLSAGCDGRGTSRDAPCDRGRRSRLLL